MLELVFSVVWDAMWSKIPVTLSTLILRGSVLYKYNIYREMLGTLFSTLTLKITLLLDETHVNPMTLCGTHFQSVEPMMISANKRVSVENVVWGVIPFLYCLNEL